MTAPLSTLRLAVLRATYLLIAAGLTATIWPLLLTRTAEVEHMRGVVWSLLGALALLSALGLRYPVKMLPLLLFELLWKVVWVGLIGVPGWSANELTPAERATLFECLVGLVIVPLALPWRFVMAEYVRASGDPWRR